MDPLPPPPPPAAPPGVPPPGWAPPGAPVWAPPPQRRSRRWVWAGVAAGLVVVAVVAVAVVGVRTKSPTAATSSPAAATFTDPTNHFSAAYHDAPVKDEQDTTVDGRAISEVFWTDTIDPNTAELVGYANFPADVSVATPNAALDDSVAGEVSNSHGTLVSKTFGMYQGFHSVDAVISASGGYVESRAVVAGRTLYVVVVTSTNNPPELFGSFANSLRILDHAS